MKPIYPETDTLLIVHLSSFEGYVRFYAATAAQKLCNDLCRAIVAHPGPVVIMDQGMEHANSPLSNLDQQSKEILIDAKKFHDRVLACEHPSLIVFHHDEIMDIAPWQHGMDKLAKVLRKLGTASVRVGGLWASEDSSTGCVHETIRQLRVRGFRCRQDKGISALEEGDPR